ncbi:ABC transporter ATP-binding protein [Fibrobacterota bacterium]
MKSREYLTEDKTIKFLDRKLWQRLGMMFRGHEVLVSIAFACVMAAEFLPQFQPRLLMQIVDGPVQNRDMAGIFPYGMMFLAVVFLSGALKYIASVSSQAVALRIIHKLRLDLFSRVQRYSLVFFKRTPVGRLMTRLTSDIDAITTMFSEGFVDLAGALLMLIFPILFMFALNWKLALAVLAVTPLVATATSIFRIKVRAVNVKIRGTIAALNTLMQESLSGNHILQMFGKLNQQKEMFHGINSELKQHWLRNVLYYAVYFPVVNGLTEISIMAMYFIGGYLFFRDQVTVGTLMAFSWYMGMFWRPMREISERYTQLQSALAAAERVFTLSDLSGELPAGNCEANPGPVTLACENVSFCYKENQPVLKNISFTLEEGENLALVGATGSGKSTLVSLCNGSYLPDSGGIKLNGQLIQDYRPGIIQGIMSYVPQDVYLFAESVAFNIALSDHVDLDRMKEVCRYVNAHSFISQMREGYQSRITERGENLSTGQRQLLAFARALYHNPRILLLDEATSAIDTETEELIQDAMGKLTMGITSLVVAHRLSTIKAADRILVLHKGEIREQGTHRELLAKKGIYRKLYQLQKTESL